VVDGAGVDRGICERRAPAEVDAIGYVQLRVLECHISDGRVKKYAYLDTFPPVSIHPPLRPFRSSDLRSKQRQTRTALYQLRRKPISLSCPLPFLPWAGRRYHGTGLQSELTIRKLDRIYSLKII
jgi:hypothetical protein